MHIIPISRQSEIRTMKAIVDTMLTIGWQFYGVSYNTDKDINELHFKESK